MDFSELANRDNSSIIARMNDSELRETISLEQEARRQIGDDRYEAVRAIAQLTVQHSLKFKLAREAEDILHPDLYSAVWTTGKMQFEDQISDMMERTVQFATDFMAWFAFPFTERKKWRVIYALDLPLHNERNMAETARIIGCTRASISLAARDFARTFGIEPSRWLRDDDAVEHSREARGNYCE